MKKDLSHIRKFRVKHPIIGSYGNHDNGCMLINSPINSRGLMFVLWSCGEGWEHVSISLKSQKDPNWLEMCHVKELLFDDEETVVQFHPKKSEYVDNHPCLHLWKKQGQEYELPPTYMVGVKSKTQEIV